MVEIDSHRFYFCQTQAQHFYPIEGPDERSSLRSLRQHIPWSSTYPPDKCSVEEFLLLHPSFPPGHPYREGTPGLYDVCRDICRKELQNTVDNFPAHREACDQCLKANCSTLLRLMCMLLLDMVGLPVKLRLNDQDMISPDGADTSRFRFTSVEPRESSFLLLCFVLESNVRTIEIAWDDLWKINLLGIYPSVSHDIADILPGWSGTVTDNEEEQFIAAGHETHLLTIRL
jgi:hypothetical protein